MYIYIFIYIYIYICICLSYKFISAIVYLQKALREKAKLELPNDAVGYFEQMFEAALHRKPAVKLLASSLTSYPYKMKNI